MQRHRLYDSLEQAVGGGSWTWSGNPRNWSAAQMDSNIICAQVVISIADEDIAVIQADIGRVKQYRGSPGWTEALSVKHFELRQAIMDKKNLMEKLKDWLAEKERINNPK